MESDKYRFLDIGGGADWGAWKNDDQSLKDTLLNLRAVRLAQGNPDNEYIVFDAYIPEAVIQNASEITNLHFVPGILDKHTPLPFGNASMDRVEMNHIYTPLTMEAEKDLWDIPIVFSLYLNALQEACLVLKPGGTLAITEKQVRLNQIERFLSDGRNTQVQAGLYTGRWMRWLGLDIFGQKTRVTDPNRTFWTQKSIKDQKYYEELGDRETAEDYAVYTLEFKKKKDVR